MEDPKKKILILGDEGVGKSALVHLWLTGTVDNEKETPSQVKEYSTDNYTLVDTPDFDRFPKADFEAQLKSSNLLVWVCYYQEKATLKSFASNFAVIKAAQVPVIIVLNDARGPKQDWSQQKHTIDLFGIGKCAFVETSALNDQALALLKMQFETFLQGTFFESEPEKAKKRANQKKAVEQQKASDSQQKEMQKRAEEQRQQKKLKEEKARRVEEKLRMQREKEAKEEALRKQEAQRRAEEERARMEELQQRVRKKEAEEKQAKRAERQLKKFGNAVDKDSDDAQEVLVKSNKELEEARKREAQAQADLAKAEQEVQRARAESQAAMQNFFGTYVAPTPSPTSYVAPPERLAEAKHKSAVVTSRDEEAGSRDDEAQPLLRINRRDLFFRYDYINPQDAKFSHSRYVSAKNINDTLAPVEGRYTDKQLIMLFAEYMKIRHVNSTLSRGLEEKLINVLGYVDPRHDVNSRRATICGKAYDRIAAGLRQKMQEKFGNTNNAFNNIDLLIDLLKVVDRLETSFWYRSNEPKIRDVIALADRVYNKLLENPHFLESSVSKLTEGLPNLPKDARKILVKRVTRDLMINPLAL